MKNADTFYKDTFDYKERRQWNLLQSASVIYAARLKDPFHLPPLKESVQDACALLAEIQNLESGE